MPRKKRPKPIKQTPPPICLDKQTNTLAYHLRHYRWANATDQDIWVFIGSRWPFLPYKAKQTLFKTQRHYPYANGRQRIDRSTIISRFPGKVVV